MLVSESAVSVAQKKNDSVHGETTCLELGPAGSETLAAMSSGLLPRESKSELPPPSMRLLGRVSSLMQPRDRARLDCNTLRVRTPRPARCPLGTHTPSSWQEPEETRTYP